MSEKRWKTSTTSVYNLGYHMLWCPKYRRPVLVGEVEQRLKALLLKQAAMLDVDIETLNIMPDHVQLFVSAPPVLAPHYIIGQLKGSTSRILRKEFPSLTSRLPSLWTRSYYVQSVGHVSEETIKRFIEDQKNR